MFCLSEFCRKDSLNNKIDEDGFRLRENLMSNFKMRIRKPVRVKKPNDLAEATNSDISSSTRRVNSSLLSVKPVLSYLPQKVISNPPTFRSSSVIVSNVDRSSPNFELNTGLDKKNGVSTKRTKSLEQIGKEKPSINRIPIFKFNPMKLSRIHLQSDKKQPPQPGLGTRSSNILVKIPSINSDDLENSISSKVYIDSRLKQEEEKSSAISSSSHERQQLKLKKLNFKILLYQKLEENSTKIENNGEESNHLLRSQSKRVSLTMKQKNHRHKYSIEISKAPPPDKKISPILSLKPKFSDAIKNREKAGISRFDDSVSSKKVRFSLNNSIFFLKK